MPNHTVLEPLLHSETLYKPGETVTMSSEAAEPLIISRVLSGPLSASGKAQLNVAETVRLVQAVSTVEELDALNADETRKGVLEAIAKRWAELES